MCKTNHICFVGKGKGAGKYLVLMFISCESMSNKPQLQKYVSSIDFDVSNEKKLEQPFTAVLNLIEKN